MSSLTTITLPQETETYLDQPVTVGAFTCRAAYVRSKDSQITGEPGQDFLTLRVDPSCLAFAVCDGVGQSFLGGEGARFLGARLVDGWLWPQRQTLVGNTEEPALVQNLTDYLNQQKTAADEYIHQAFNLDEVEDELTRTALKNQRKRSGTQSNFVCGIIFSRSDQLPDGRVLLFWLGDAQLHIYKEKAEMTGRMQATWDSHEGWSSKYGVTGSIHFYCADLFTVDGIIAHTDGLNPLAKQLRPGYSSKDLNKGFKALYQTPGSDDISYLEITASPEVSPAPGSPTPDYLTSASMINQLGGIAALPAVTNLLAPQPVNTQSAGVEEARKSPTEIEETKVLNQAGAQPNTQPSTPPTRQPVQRKRENQKNAAFILIGFLFGFCVMGIVVVLFLSNLGAAGLRLGMVQPSPLAASPTSQIKIQRSPTSVVEAVKLTATTAPSATQAPATVLPPSETPLLPTGPTLTPTPVSEILSQDNLFRLAEVQTILPPAPSMVAAWRDSPYLTITRKDGIHVYDWVNNAEVNYFPYRGPSLKVLYQDSSWLVFAVPEGEMYLWDFNQNQPDLRRLNPSANNMLALTRSVDGKSLTGVSLLDGKLVIWESSPGSGDRELGIYPINPAEPVTSLRFSSSGSALALGFQDGRFQVIDLESKQTQAEWCGYKPITALHWSADGQLLFATDGSAICRVTMENPAETATLPVTATKEINQLETSLDNSLMIGITTQGSLWLLDLKNNKEMSFPVPFGDLPVRQVVFQADGKALFIVTADEAVHIYQVEKPKTGEENNP